MDKVVRCAAGKYADETKIGRVVECEDGNLQLQKTMGRGMADGI